MLLQSRLNECENEIASLEARIATLEVGLEASQTEKRALEKHNIELEDSKSFLKQQLVGDAPSMRVFRVCVKIHSVLSSASHCSKYNITLSKISARQSSRRMHEEHSIWCSYWKDDHSLARRDCTSPLCMRFSYFYFLHTHTHTRTQDAYRSGTLQFSSIFTSDDDSFMSGGEHNTAGMLGGMCNHESEEESDAQQQHMSHARDHVAEQGSPKSQGSRWPSRHMVESIARSDQLLRARLSRSGDVSVSDSDMNSSMRHKSGEAASADVSGSHAGTPKRHNSLMSWLSPMKRRNHVSCSRGEGFEAALALALDKVKEAKSARMDQMSAMEVLKDKVLHPSMEKASWRGSRGHEWNM